MPMNYFLIIEGQQPLAAASQSYDTNFQIKAPLSAIEAANYRSSNVGN